MPTPEPQSSLPDPPSDHRRIAWWLWPNLLSLDAPLVAMAWLWLFARAWGVTSLAWQAYLALGLAVWVIYVCDKLLDVRIRTPGDPALVARHAFHARHPRAFLIGCAAAGVWVGGWALTSFSLGSLAIHAAPAVIFVALFFGLVALVGESHKPTYARNILAGLAFGCGTSMLAQLERVESGVGEMLVGPEVVLFSLLCTLNINAIHLWEQERMGAEQPPASARAMALIVPLWTLGAVAWFSMPAVSIGVVLLLVVDRLRERMSLDLLRVLADVALLLPLPLGIAWVCFMSTG